MSSHTTPQLITDNLDLWTTAIKKRSATGRGSNKKIELTGIKKLRELILELAVRGKLVPQDPNDEPASVLLEKIAAEKAQLIKDKKIKKSKVLPEIGEHEKPFELPNNWEWCRLMELVYLLGDGLHGTPEYTLNEKYYFINGNNLKDGKIIIKHETKTVAQDQFDKYKKDLSSNTVLVSINGTLGNVAFYNNEKIVLGKSACYFNLANSIYKSYIKLVIESPRFLKYAFEKATGSTIKNLGLKAMNELPLALPSLSEQHRIVAKVDKLMALCDQLEQQTEDSITAHQTLVETLLTTLSNSETPAEFQQNWIRIAEHFDTLFTTEHSIDQLKQTILQLAVMGKLVPQNPDDEPASVLLEKIAAEKEQLIKDKKIKKQKPLPAITEDEKPFELPSGWEWSRLGLITEIGPRNNLDDDIQVSFVPMPLITTNHDGSHGQEVRKWREIKKGYTHFSNGDIALAKITPCFENSKAAVFTGLKNGYGAGTTELHVARPFGETLNRLFILLYLKAPQFLRVGKTKMTGSAGQKRVPTDFFKGNPIPIPPLAEQHRIVKKVDKLITLCDQLKARLSDAQATQLCLADTLVEQAVS